LGQCGLIASGHVCNTATIQSKMLAKVLKMVFCFVYYTKRYPKLSTTVEMLNFILKMSVACGINHGSQMSGE